MLEGTDSVFIDFARKQPKAQNTIQ